MLVFFYKKSAVKKRAEKDGILGALATKFQAEENLAS